MRTAADEDGVDVSRARRASAVAAGNAAFRAWSRQMHAWRMAATLMWLVPIVVGVMVVVGLATGSSNWVLHTELWWELGLVYACFALMSVLLRAASTVERQVYAPGWSFLAYVRPSHAMVASCLIATWLFCAGAVLRWMAVDAHGAQALLAPLFPTCTAHISDVHRGTKETTTMECASEVTFFTGFVFVWMALWEYAVWVRSEGSLLRFPLLQRGRWPLVREALPHDVSLALAWTLFGMSAAYVAYWAFGASVLFPAVLDVALSFRGPLRGSERESTSGVHVIRVPGGILPWKNVSLTAQLVLTCWAIAMLWRLTQRLVCAIHTQRLFFDHARSLVPPVGGSGSARDRSVAESGAFAATASGSASSLVGSGTSTGSLAPHVLLVAGMQSGDALVRHLAFLDLAALGTSTSAFGRRRRAALWSDVSGVAWRDVLRTALAEVDATARLLREWLTADEAEAVASVAMRHDVAHQLSMSALAADGLRRHKRGGRDRGGSRAGRGDARGASTLQARLRTPGQQEPRVASVVGAASAAAAAASMVSHALGTPPGAAGAGAGRHGGGDDWGRVGGGGGGGGDHGGVAMIGVSGPLLSASLVGAPQAPPSLRQRWQQLWRLRGRRLSDHVFGRVMPCVWAVQGLSGLVAASLSEDGYGIVSVTDSLPAVVQSVLRLQQAIQAWITSSSERINPPMPPSLQGHQWVHQQPAVLMNRIRTGMYRLVTVFGPELTTVYRWAPDVADDLQRYVVYSA